MNVQHPLKLDRPDGQLAYELHGSGRLVVCVPGMGDLRSTYRYLAPSLAAAGYRVAVMDLRGHGDSDTSFRDFGGEATAGDIAALIDTIGGPAVIVGNSMAAASAVLVAADRPELVSGLVLIGPFVRDPPTNAASRLAMRVVMASPWAARAWTAYLPSLFAGQRPDDFDAYRERIGSAIRRPGYARAFSLTTRTSHRAAEAALTRVDTRTLVIMGERDPDFPEPRAEADWIAGRLRADVVMVPDAGHYPQSQRPDIVVPAVASFLDSAGADA